MLLLFGSIVCDGDHLHATDTYDVHWNLAGMFASPDSAGVTWVMFDANTYLVFFYAIRRVSMYGSIQRKTEARGCDQQVLRRQCRYCTMSNVT